MFTLGCLLQINQKTSPRSQKEPEKVTGKQLVSLRERLFQTIKNPLGEDLSRVSFPTELLVCSVHLFPREKKGPNEPRDAVRGRLPVVPPSHWRSMDALVLRWGKARRRGLTRSSQPLHKGDLTTAHRGSQVKCTYIFIHKSGQTNLKYNSLSRYIFMMSSIRLGPVPFQTFYRLPMQSHMWVIRMECPGTGVWLYSWSPARVYVSVPHWGQKCHTPNPVQSS